MADEDLPLGTSAREADRFAIVARTVGQDQRLTYRARGLLVHILTAPAEWGTSAAELADRAPEGRDAVREAVKELLETGYMYREKRRTGAGTFEWALHVTDDPVGKPITSLPAKPAPDTGQLTMRGFTADGSAADGSPESDPDPTCTSCRTETSPQPPPREPTSDAEQLCRALAESLIARGVERAPKVTDRWKDEMRRLIDMDGIPAETIAETIQWSARHEYWAAVVLSPHSLRRHYDRLRLQMRRQAGGLTAVDGLIVDDVVTEIFNHFDRHQGSNEPELREETRAIVAAKGWRKLGGYQRAEMRTVVRSFLQAHEDAPPTTEED